MQDITPFTQNARIGKTCKQQFFERFYNPAGGEEARLAWFSGLLTGPGKSR